MKVIDKIQEALVDEKKVVFLVRVLPAEDGGWGGQPAGEDGSDGGSQSDLLRHHVGRRSTTPSRPSSPTALQNVLALRGDPPHGQDKFVQIQGGFACALDLVTHIRATYGDYFGITVAGYPEAHPDAIEADGLATPESYQSDLAYLKRKVDAGADLIVTQLFYDTDVFPQIRQRLSPNRNHLSYCSWNYAH
ncbi:hypothetical protein M0R45_002884 [Rubus argutus]|uniref:Methylenetetrahydrofolate reductase n=1 Tax=Rubus argutus TaxID=59490 RepID=A0AAW1YGC4_RUBAR